MVDPWLEDGGGIAEERLAEETGVPPTALCVEDPEVRSPARRPGPVAGDDHLRPLTDDVPAETDPGPSSELQAETGRLGDGGRGPAGQARRLEDHEQDLRPTGEGGEPPESIRDRGGAAAVAALGTTPGIVRSGWQINDEQVHRPAGDEGTGHRQRFVERGRLENDQPLEMDPPGDRLDRIETSSQIDVGDDRADRLRFGSQAQGQRGLAAGRVAAHGERGRARDPARAQDGVQGRKARGDDPLVVDDPGRMWVRFVRERDRGECADHRSVARAVPPTGPWCGISPTCLKRRQGRRHVRRKGRHRTTHDRTDVLSRQ
jgi:hypothetical protein